MKAFVAVLAALLVAQANAGDHYERMLMKWGKMKAMEGCFGEENSEKFIIKMKKAKAVCSGKPAPELHLPMFDGKVRIANALIEGSGDDDFGFGGGMMMKKMFKAMMFKRFMKSQLQDFFDDDDDFDGDDFEGHHKRRGGPMRRFFGRHRREVGDTDGMDDDEELDLGDMMVEKLENMEAMFEAKVGNITCILREVNVINGNNEIDLPRINDAIKNEMVWTADREWLRDEMLTIHSMCKDVADAVPQSVLDHCQIPHYLTRLGYFKKCLKMKKVEACMFSDVRQKVAKHGMSVEGLAKRAGIEEKQLVPLMAHVVFGDKH